MIVSLSHFFGSENASLFLAFSIQGPGFSAITSISALIVGHTIKSAHIFQKSIRCTLDCGICKWFAFKQHFNFKGLLALKFTVRALVARPQA